MRGPHETCGAFTAKRSVRQLRLTLKIQSDYEFSNSIKCFLLLLITNEFTAHCFRNGFNPCGTNLKVRKRFTAAVEALRSMSTGTDEIRSRL